MIHIRTPATYSFMQTLSSKINCTFLLCTAPIKKNIHKPPKLHNNFPHPLHLLPIIYIHLSFFYDYYHLMSVSQERRSLSKKIFTFCRKSYQNFTTKQHTSSRYTIYYCRYLAEPYCFVIFLLSDSHL